MKTSLKLFFLSFFMSMMLNAYVELPQYQKFWTDSDEQVYEPNAPVSPAAVNSNQPTPWLTGPLIAPVGTVVPLGHFTIESYLYFTTNIGSYDSHWNFHSSEHNLFAFNPQIQCFFGLTPWMDINLIPQFSIDASSNQRGARFGDFALAFDFQPLSATATPYFPGIKLTFKETFPTGNYQKLNPDKLGTTQTGSGAYATTFQAVLYKVYHLGQGHHFLSTTYSLAYTLNSSVPVQGFNTYGGGAGVNGTVIPGNNTQAIISFEFALTQRWVLALDNVYSHTNRTKFFGDSTAANLQAANSVPASSEQFSFAPAIEYNFSSHFGIISGCWFTAWGRNSTRFVSGIINFVYNF